MASKKGKTSVQPARLRQSVATRARASVITEMRMKGVPRAAIGRHFHIGKSRVTQVIKWAEQHGVVEEIRERMRFELLPQSEAVYRQILSSSAGELADPAVVQGYALKLKAAKHMADGLGAFHKLTAPIIQEKQELDLAGFYAQRQGQLDGYRRGSPPPELPGEPERASPSEGDGDGIVDGVVSDAGPDMDGDDRRDDRE